jgi:hypothetical protein
LIPGATCRGLAAIAIAVVGCSVAAPAHGLFTPTGSMILDRDYHTATLLLDGGVLIAGGDDALSATRYLG